MKNILIVAPSISKGGGAEKTAAMLVNELAKQSNYLVFLAVTVEKENDYELQQNVEKIVLSNVGVGALKNCKRIINIIKIIREKKIDLVIGYTIIGGIISCIAAKIAHTKVIVCERQDPHAFSKKMRMIRDCVYKSATGAIFQTNDAALYFTNICKNNVVIPNFIDNDVLPTPQNYCERQNVIVAVGRLAPVKNHALFIKSIKLIEADLNDWNVEIIGDGPEKENLEHLINELQLQNKVRLAGYSSNVLECINNYKILVLPSRYEGYPNALLEGMAMGLTCISSDCPCGGPRDMISNGINGVLVSNISEENLAFEIKKCINDSKFSRELAGKALEVRKTNAKEFIMKRWLEFIAITIKE